MGHVVFVHFVKKIIDCVIESDGSNVWLINSKETCLATLKCWAFF